MTTRFTNRLILALVALLLCGSSASACSCLSVGPVCVEAVAPENAAIFVGRVQLVRPTLSSGLTQFAVTFAIEEAFQGVEGRWVTVQTPVGEPACGFDFHAGKRYLVYASRHEGALQTSICSRTGLVDYRQEDLSHLRGMNSLPPTSRVYGEYKRYTFDPGFVPQYTPNLADHYSPPEETYRAMAPMSGETVTLRSASGQAYSAKVDAEGRFTFPDVQPGEYSIEASAPEKFAKPRGYVPGAGKLEAFVVQPRGCAEVNLRTQPDGLISGRVVNSDGKPVYGALVKLWKPGNQHDYRKSETWEFASDHNGTFEIGPLPPGEYILGWHIWKLPGMKVFGSTTSDHLRETTLRFYPGTSDPAAAAPIVLGFGEHRKNLKLVIPAGQLEPPKKP